MTDNFFHFLNTKEDILRIGIWVTKQLMDPIDFHSNKK